MLKSEDDAIDFSLKDRTGTQYSFKDFRNKNLVLYFYPKDDTPGCTIEANSFNQHLSAFKKLNTEVIGISGGDEQSKEKFCKKYGLKLLLLSDPDFGISRTYGVYGEKSFLGRKFMGIRRTTFILNKNRKILKVYEAVKPEAHAQEVLEFLKAFKKQEEAERLARRPDKELSNR